MSKTIWQYSEQTLTGWAIVAIGTAALVAGIVFDNFLAVILGALALTIGTHRISYAHGMRDMHELDIKLPDDQHLADFEIQLTTEDEK